MKHSGLPHAFCPHLHLFSSMKAMYLISLAIITIMFAFQISHLPVEAHQNPWGKAPRKQDLTCRAFNKVYIEDLILIHQGFKRTVGLSTLFLKTHFYTDFNDKACASELPKWYPRNESDMKLLLMQGERLRTLGKRKALLICKIRHSAVRRSSLCIPAGK